MSQVNNELEEKAADYVNRVNKAIQLWQGEQGYALVVDESYFRYSVVDLLDVAPSRALAFLLAIDAEFHPAYHGMHNNEFRKASGMPDVTIWENLDPTESHQSPERKAVYATTNLIGGLVHATLEHKKVDANPVSGETYSLRPMPGEDGTDSFIEVSPHLDKALRAGDERFTDGILYILPPEQFVPNPHSSHEVTAMAKVSPFLVVRVRSDIVRDIVMSSSVRWIRND
jgi:hypothetical protein